MRVLILTVFLSLVLAAPAGAVSKATARKAVAAYEARTETPTTILKCRHERKHVVCFLTRPYPEGPDSAVVAVEWWDCVGPRGIVTSTLTNVRCQFSAYYAFPELHEQQ